jgi:hypothetical protein
MSSNIPSVATTSSQQLKLQQQQQPLTANAQQQQQQQRQQPLRKNNNDSSSSSSNTITTTLQSISNVCIDTYQCLCLFPVYPNYTTEYLEYNYNNINNTNNNNTTTLSQSQQLSSLQSQQQQQQLVRIRNRGEYYIDSYNDQPKSFSFGTNENVRSFFILYTLLKYLIRWTPIDRPNNYYCLFFLSLSFLLLLRLFLYFLPDSYSYYRMVFGVIPVIKLVRSCQH